MEKGIEIGFLFIQYVLMNSIPVQIFLYIFPLLLAGASIILNFRYCCCVIKITFPGKQYKKTPDFS